MSDYHSRAFRAQLTTTMDSLLRTAVFEISKVYDTNIYNHQVELAQKTAEITQLQRKLLRAESKLREGRGMDCGPEETITIEDEEEPSADEILEIPQIPQMPESHEIPEIEIDLPDDWCSPVATEEAPVQEEYSDCPSVTLRPLSVSLWRIPAIKQEVMDDDFESHLLTSLTGSPKNSSLSQKRKELKHLQSLNLPTRLRNSADRELRRNVNADKSSVVRNAGKKRKTSSEPVREEKQGKSSGKIYSCKFCSKVFDTEFGLSVHVRSHKKCPKCQKVFPFPSSLRIHMPYCRIVKNESAPKKEKSAQNMKSPNRDDPTTSGKASSKIKSPNKDDPTTSGKASSKIKSPNKDDPTTSGKDSVKRSSTKTCRDCGLKFPHIYALRVHKGVCSRKQGNNFDCNMCTQKFPRKSLLKKHLFNVHGRKMKRETNGDLSWMKPLEDAVETKVASSVSQKIPIPPTENKDVQLATKPKKLKKEAKDWTTMGKEVPDGFSCSQCKKVISTKYLLIEHYRIHTGERPLMCEGCGKRFRCHSLRSHHRKSCLGQGAMVKSGQGAMVKSVPCQLCGKKFPTESICNKHIMNVHKCWPNVCEHCGKGFANAKRLRNHCERFHVQA